MVTGNPPLPAPDPIADLAAQVGAIRAQLSAWEALSAPRARTRLDRALGPTAGMQDGNVRACLSLLAGVGLHALAFFLIYVQVWRGADLHASDVITGLVVLDTSAVSYYYGRRQGQQE